MISFSACCNFVNEVVEKHKLSSIIKSIYVYGSIATGDFENKFSNMDFYFVVHYSTVQERIVLVSNLKSIFELEIFQYIDSLHKKEDIEEYSNPTTWFFSEDEFNIFCASYPTRFVYPVKYGACKLAYGKDYLTNVDLPDRETCIRYLQHDYETASQSFQLSVFTAEYKKNDKDVFAFNAESYLDYS